MVLKHKVVQTIIAMLTEDKVTEIFYMADEFCKFFDRITKKYTLEAPSRLKYHRDGYGVQNRHQNLFKKCQVSVFLCY